MRILAAIISISACFFFSELTQAGTIEELPIEFAAEAGTLGDGILDVIINPVSGNVTVDTNGLEVVAVVIDSTAGIFNGPNSPSWDNPSVFAADLDTQISMPFTFLNYFGFTGIDDLGEGIIGDWPEDFDYLADLTVIYLDFNTRDLLDANAIIVPEPSGFVLFTLGSLFYLVVRTCRKK